MQCSISNFEHLSQEVQQKKIVSYFSMYFYGSNPRTPAKEYLGPWDLGLDKLGNGLLGNATDQNFKHLGQEVLKKKTFEYSPCIAIIRF